MTATEGRGREKGRGTAFANTPYPALPGRSLMIIKRGERIGTAILYAHFRFYLWKHFEKNTLTVHSQSIEFELCASILLVIQ